ncbi:hypothetical protein SAMN05421833_14726 [Microbispora rosea]|uniref:Uncharacterized protein n=1 Tax=Microbispora rosea TaxID=58117 RepID=A0A1N7HG48_9ACTN|nr:hypothetical protein [Microbispora rosea]SIS23650.1 hypothetical protein SAMN05421833_14726 [Microbispora rosea]
MTANKHFKRRVRERARRTGESYTAALRHLRRVDAEEHRVQWKRIERPDFAYAVHVPQGWHERPPNTKNSPWETARYGDHSDRRHGAIVFRQPVRPGRTSAEMAEIARSSLESLGFADIEIVPARLGERDGALLSGVKRDAGRALSIREYMAMDGDVGFCLGCWSTVPEEDLPLFEAMAGRFEILVDV